MKANRLRWFLPFLLGSAVFQLHAQPSEADRKMLTPIGGFGGGPLFPAQQSDPDYGAWLADVRAKAEKGDAQSQLDLGTAFELGIPGVAKSAAEAARWYRKAAVQGDAAAQSTLADCYLNGRGVAQDKREAVNWFRKAAEQGDSFAQFFLGHCYAFGQGVAKEEVEAVKWYRKAAEQNLCDAQLYLGISYVNGEGVAKDYLEAYKWNLLASARGMEVAKTIVSLLARTMTREQIAEGQKLARNFKPRAVPASGGDRMAQEISK